MEVDSNIDDILAGLSTSPDIPSASHDLQLLTRAWVAERTAPALLPYPTDLLGRVLPRLRTQIEHIEALASDTTTTSGGSGAQSTPTFALVILQLDLERVKFLLRSLLRARLAKIDAHAEWLAARDAGAGGLLGAEELAYLHAKLALWRAVVAGVGGEVAGRAAAAAGEGGEGWDSLRVVFVRVLRPHGEWAVGEVYVVRWEEVSALVEEGGVELV
ncbi:MAG: GINS complex subunit [Trizodia sp. TS-e1964]|nr:MAG: GINS complex subunit [Trizodia sp. TS-e1964]